MVVVAVTKPGLVVNQEVTEAIPVVTDNPEDMQLTDNQA